MFLCGYNLKIHELKGLKNSKLINLKTHELKN